ncbi:MAG: hypothetical protein ACRD9Q_02310 [Nitrososphaeraceae archaeon]
MYKGKSLFKKFEKQDIMNFVGAHPRLMTSHLYYRNNHRRRNEEYLFLDELLEVRNTLLIYKLLHHNDKIPDIKVSLENRDKTIAYFNKYFDKDTFDYMKYEPEHGIVILNLHSDKTQKQLNKLLKELLNETRKYLKIQ